MKGDYYICSNCGHGSSQEILICSWCGSVLSLCRKKPDIPVFKNQSELFSHIWKVRKHVSEISGEPLEEPMNAFYFLHILPKGTYPKFKLLEDNIMLGSMNEHIQIDNGTQEDRRAYELEHGASFDIFYDKQAELKKIYPK